MATKSKAETARVKTLRTPQQCPDCDAKPKGPQGLAAHLRTTHGKNLDGSPYVVAKGATAVTRARRARRTQVVPGSDEATLNKKLLEVVELLFPEGVPVKKFGRVQSWMDATKNLNK